MRFKAILFDLDGTLLPMDNDEFVKHAFPNCGLEEFDL
jgi:FMN phosphatase YigB (HAD superfamily)